MDDSGWWLGAGDDHIRGRSRVVIPQQARRDGTLCLGKVYTKAKPAGASRDLVRRGQVQRVPNAEGVCSASRCPTLSWNPADIGVPGSVIAGRGASDG
jgi:hypothetical protein